MKRTYWLLEGQTNLRKGPFPEWRSWTPFRMHWLVDEIGFWLDAHYDRRHFSRSVCPGKPLPLLAVWMDTSFHNVWFKWDLLRGGVKLWHELLKLLDEVIQSQLFILLFVSARKEEEKNVCPNFLTVVCPGGTHYVTCTTKPHEEAMVEYGALLPGWCAIKVFFILHTLTEVLKDPKKSFP